MTSSSFHIFTLIRHAKPGSFLLAKDPASHIPFLARSFFLYLPGLVSSGCVSLLSSRYAITCCLLVFCCNIYSLFFSFYYTLKQYEQSSLICSLLYALIDVFQVRKFCTNFSCTPLNDAGTVVGRLGLQSDRPCRRLLSPHHTLISFHYRSIFSETSMMVSCRV